MTQERDGKGEGPDRAEDRYPQALERHGLEDLRPVCRSLLVELRDSDPAAYDTAVRRYEEELQPELEAGAADPVVAWLRYGAWLADRLRDGRALAVDPGGRARALEAAAERDDFPTRHLVLHLPEEWRDGGRIIAVPAEPTEHQEATRELFGS